MLHDAAECFNIMAAKAGIKMSVKYEVLKALVKAIGIKKRWKEHTGS